MQRSSLPGAQGGTRKTGPAGFSCYCQKKIIKHATLRAALLWCKLVGFDSNIILRSVRSNHRVDWPLWCVDGTCAVFAGELSNAMRLNLVQFVDRFEMCLESTFYGKPIQGELLNDKIYVNKFGRILLTLGLGVFLHMLFV